MRKTLFSSAYLAPVEYYAYWVQAERPVIEVHENYRKQSYRSRAYIGSANGALALNIPVVHSGDGQGHRKMKEAETAIEFRWVQRHFRSLETAYRTSPYFEYYEDRFRALYFGGDVENLLGFNLRAHALVCDLLSISPHIERTDCYQESPAETSDLRRFFSPKGKNTVQWTPYTQVFENKFGFQGNLSIADLLFCVGPGSLDYLKNVKL